MKLLRSTFLAFCVVSSASGFAPRISSKSSSINDIINRHRRSTSLTTITTGNETPVSSTSLFVGIHEQPASSISEDDIRKETMFIQVRKEVGTAKEYLNWLIEECGTGTVTDADGDDSTTKEGEGITFADVIADKAAAGEVELFGGGGDAPPPGSSASPSERKGTTYRPALRTDLGDTVLLTGTMDSTLLNILNNNFFGRDSVPNFEFAAIRALAEDVPAARKRAIGREARYGGLLDKLTIEPSTGDLPTEDELAGASSWIVQLNGTDGDAAATAATLSKIADLAAGSAKLTNVIVMLAGATSTDGWDAVEAASADGDAFRCTLLSVGELYDASEEKGGFYRVGAAVGEGEGAAMMPRRLSRTKAYRLLAHALALDSTAGRALAARDYSATVVEATGAPYAEGEFVVRDDDGNEVVDEFRDIKMESRVIQAMRETGFTQVMELDVLVDKGLAGYNEYIANPPNKENAFAARNKSRDEEDEKILAILDAEIAVSDARKKDEAAKQKQIEIEGIAKEWAIKEYSLRMIGGDLDDSISEEDFMESSRDEALAEGERTYERINSEDYIKEQERVEKAKLNVENKLFWDGMPPVLRKKREKMVEKVKRQYMDLLSEEDLERIILNDD
mmetsp:Transcript_25805/g.46754  ORF Transcript_25805/g.46754 Transcript_25805/m.46754 type:complete len:622 (+) Transcript_25805:151-2016(+)